MLSFKRLPFLIVLSSCIFLFSCQRKEQKITGEEALSLAKKIEVEMAKHDPSLINDFIDDKEFVKKMNEASGQQQGSSFTQGVTKGLKERKIGNEIISNTGQGGSYLLVKSYEKSNRQHLLFRMFTGEGAVNYHDYELVKFDNKIKAADMYVYMTGENLSKTIGDLTLQLLDDKGVATDSQKGKLKLITKLNDATKNQRFKDAQKILQQFPAEMKREKFYYMANIQVASGLNNDSAYAQSLFTFQKHFPDEPNMQLMLIDYYFLKQDYPNCIQCVNKLDSLINKDPFLDYYRGLIYKMMGESTQEMIALERLHTAMPTFEKGLLELMHGYASIGEYEKSAAVVAEYKNLPLIKTEQLDYLYQTYPDLESYVH